jgi:hypothetical protein
MSLFTPFPTPAEAGQAFFYSLITPNPTFPQDRGKEYVFHCLSICYENECLIPSPLGEG